jgi:glucans biosynthesis protein
MHGGAPGSGASKGNQSAVKHGFYTTAAIEERHRVRQLIRQSKELLRDFK